MLTSSQSIRAWLEFQRCTNAVLTMAGRPDPRAHTYVGTQPCDAGKKSVAAWVRQCCAGSQPGGCQKQLLTEIETYNFCMSV